MTQMNFREPADFIQNDLRLKTFPVAVKFLKDTSDLLAPLQKGLFDPDTVAFYDDIGFWNGFRNRVILIN